MRSLPAAAGDDRPPAKRPPAPASVPASRWHKSCSLLFVTNIKNSSALTQIELLAAMSILLILAALSCR